ncbi:hypothetical protein BCT94_02630 [Vibrio breoganii]|nr:hypothetical protein A1QG_15080 [Vibrio breoganii ZF-29]PMK54531.1 hypothetical protein BCT98_01715 [Vibrio breoganii]PMK67926.1 hypothetical protein BCT94_02630 [Vibrio breoganii]
MERNPDKITMNSTALGIETHLSEELLIMLPTFEPLLLHLFTIKRKWFVAIVRQLLRKWND